MMSAVAALDVRPVSRLFKALADETRLRIVALLAHGELCVCHIHEALGLSQPNVSRHLAVLRAAGIVADRRDGKWIYYSLLRQQDPDSERQLRALVKAYSKREVLRDDVARLIEVCGPRACP
jgi:ArsR family transcriptional regulator